MKINHGRARPPGAPGTRAQDGRLGDPSLPILPRSIPRILRSAGYPASHRHQHTRPKVSPPRSRQPHGHLSRLHLQVRSWRLAGQQVYAARPIADSGKNWRQCATGRGIQSRRRTGEIVLANSPGRDPIVTRILWLRGLEAQNANAFGRDIYIHGTPEERLIGTPASYGCIRMRSTDVVQLYNIVGVGAAVTIVDAPLVSAVPGMVSGHSMGPENTAPFVMR